MATENTRDRILRYIEEHKGKEGYAPTVREIADHVGKGVATVKYHLDAMVLDGTLRRSPRSPRALTVVGEGGT